MQLPIEYEIDGNTIRVKVLPFQRSSFGRSGLPYYGGKEYMLEDLLGFLPPPNAYLKYVEVFGGSGVLLFNKPRSQIEYFNDKDKFVVKFFRVLRDNGEELIKRLALTPYSREERRLCALTVLYRTGRLT